MQSVSATDAKQRFAAVPDAAQEYDRPRGLNVAEFEEYCDRVGAAGGEKFVHEGTPLVSDELMRELARALGWEKLDPYVTVVERQELLRRLGRVAARVEVIYRVQACWDAKDDMVLEAAVNGEAEVIVTGDGDLVAD